MVRTAFLVACALCATLGFAQDDSFDNSKLAPLLGDWVGTTQFQDTKATPGTIKGAKVLADRWIKLDLKFELEGIGPVEAAALICSDADGKAEGHFFVSMANKGLFGKGTVTAGKLNVTATSIDGEASMNFEFDMSVKDQLKFSVSEAGQTMLSGSYTRKK